MTCMRCGSPATEAVHTEHIKTDVAGEKNMTSQPVASSMPRPGTDEFAAACRKLDHRSFGYRFVKRVFDIAISGVAIAIGLIPGVILSAVVAADTKGLPIYSQVRVGKDGRPFRLYKFRSMVADADNVEKYLTPEQLEVWQRERKVDDDPRITRLGGIIRKTSLAPVIIGAPGDGEPTKSLSHPENSSLDLQKCERRPGTSLGARHHYTSFQFLSFAVFGGSEDTSGRHLCAFARAPFAAVGTVA